MSAPESAKAYNAHTASGFAAGAGTSTVKEKAVGSCRKGAAWGQMPRRCTEPLRMLEPREARISGEKSKLFSIPCGSPRTSASGAVTIHGMAVGINNFINKDNAQALIFLCAKL